VHFYDFSRSLLKSEAWREMRRGIADLPRRARVSHQGNERYLGARASVEADQRLGELTERLEQPRQWKGKRALHPFGAPDSTLWEAISRGEWTVRGFRNRELQLILFGQPASSPEATLRRVSRQLRLLGPPPHS
jgi:hypothetical protein